MLCLLYLVGFCTQGSDSEGPVDKLTLLGMQTWAVYQERIPSIQASRSPWLAFARLSLP